MVPFVGSSSIIEGSRRREESALILEISLPEKHTELRAIRSPFFGDRIDLTTALATTLASERETQRLVRVHREGPVLRLNIEGGTAYRQRSLVQSILVEP